MAVRFSKEEKQMILISVENDITNIKEEIDHSLSPRSREKRRKELSEYTNLLEKVKKWQEK